MSTGKILFICGSANQTSMMHKVSAYFPDFECSFSPYYGDRLISLLAHYNVLNFTILGGQFKRRTLEYLKTNNLRIDEGGKKGTYNLVFTCSDLIIPKNVLNSNIVLVQEGMTDPEDFMFRLVKNLKLPRYLASTSATGLSDQYNMFCVASEGYKNFFIDKGIKEEKIVVTGIPNFDDCKSFLANDFPHKNYVLVATSDLRETFKYENRKALIKKAVQIAAGRQIIFKLHPNENVERATAEINLYAPGALIYSSGPTEYMVANCETLITRYSTVVYIGLALGKEVYSDFRIEHLRELMPLQNGGASARNIAQAARQLMKMSTPQVKMNKRFSGKKRLIPGRIIRT